MSDLSKDRAEPLHYDFSDLAAVLITRGGWLIQQSGRMLGSGTAKPWQLESIRRALAEIEVALLAYENAEFEVHQAKRPPPSAVTSEPGASEAEQ